MGQECGLPTFSMWFLLTVNGYLRRKIPMKVISDLVVIQVRTDSNNLAPRLSHAKKKRDRGLI